MSVGDICLGLLAILFPPLAVWVKRGICSADSFLNILLLILGYIPGLLHAWYVIARYPEYPEDYEAIPSSDGRGGDIESGRGGGGRRVTYVYVTHPSAQGEIEAAQRQQQEQGGGADGRNLQIGAGYGATEGSGEGGSSRPPPTYAEAVKAVSSPPADGKARPEEQEGNN